MASSDKPSLSSKRIALESDCHDNNTPCINIFLVNLSLRLLLFALTLIGIVILIISKQTKLIKLQPSVRTPLRPNLITFRPSYTCSRSDACFYSILSSIVSFRAMPSPSKKLLFSLTSIDGLMAGIVGSGLGAAAAAICYVGWKGNSQARWNRVCTVFDIFCRHAAVSAAMVFFASVVLLLLLLCSTYSR